MTDEEKLQAIEDMGIDINNDCPSDFNFFESKICLSYYNCLDCWIKALEAVG
jgi:hypothetical protein